MRSPQSISRARQLRRTMTPPEVRLWLRLRAVGSDQPRFRRQHPMGPYVLDFYCPRAKLAVEVDGIAHGIGDQAVRDERRDVWLRDQGVHVLRIPASAVMDDADEETDHILRLALARIAGLA